MTKHDENLIECAKLIDERGIDNFLKEIFVYLYNPEQEHRVTQLIRIMKLYDKELRAMKPISFED